MSVWRLFTREEKIWRYKNSVRAVDFHRRYLLKTIESLLISVSCFRLLIRRYFFMWLKYILLKDSIEKSARSVEFLRTKVSLLLPDYVPGRGN